MNEPLTPQEQQELSELVRAYNDAVLAKEGHNTFGTEQAMEEFCQRLADASPAALAAFRSSHPDRLFKVSPGRYCW